MNEKLLKAVILLDRVVTEYFKDGAQPGEFAFANVAIARAYIENLLDEELGNELIAAYESHPNHTCMIFSDDQAIKNQIDKLEEQLEMLSQSTAARNELILIGKSPHIQLVHSRGQH